MGDITICGRLAAHSTNDRVGRLIFSSEIYLPIYTPLIIVDIEKRIVNDYRKVVQ